MTNMSDYERLSTQQKAVLNIKVDGHIEACIAAARRLNLGVLEALELCLLATLREFKAHGLDSDKARSMWIAASAKYHLQQLPGEQRAVN